MPPLQFRPLASQPTPEFWSALTALKLDKLRLDDSVIPVHAWIEEGRELVNLNKLTGKIEGENVAVDGSVFLPGSAFEELGVKPTPSSRLLPGIFKNYNTVEEFRSSQAKKDVFDSAVTTMLASFEDESPKLNLFVLVAFADLKKYTYHYWFAFPALVSKPAWQLQGDLEAVDTEDLKELRGLALDMPPDASAFLVKGGKGQRQAARLSRARTFFDGVPTDQQLLVFHDSSALPKYPGWGLRNVLYYLQSKHGISEMLVVCLRQGSSSRQGRVFREDSEVSTARPQSVGWERDGAGKLASRVANLGPMLDPARLAEQAVDLNLKLMRWRILPDLDLDKVAATKCLLLGAGTLGCYVSRALMGWGVRKITFVDSARVSYSNPVRQPLFRFEDCLDGGRPKAECAAERLKEIFPSVDASGYSMSIPMPGHPVSPGEEQRAAEDVRRLEDLVRNHDAIFLLMDSRESRWLPTVLGASGNKIVINAALGFDSYLVMRHGVFTTQQPARRLGCYFCNDVVAPADSLTDRTLDQMCTVTRPGVAPIAAATAVELLVSTVQHPLGSAAPAEKHSDRWAASDEVSPLGPVPHQLRGMLSQWNCITVEGLAYDRCTGCSPTITDAYRSSGFAFLLRAFNETGYLESVTGLDKLHAEAEAVLDSLDWEESTDSESGLM